MVELNETLITIILAIICCVVCLGLVLCVGVVFMFFVFQDDTSPSIPVVTPTIPTIANQTDDLTGGFGAWINRYPNLDVLCAGINGNWHWEKNFVGCEGNVTISATACDDPLADMVRGRCENATGKFTCSAEGIYCKIE